MNLKQRSFQREWMDEEGLDPSLHAEALRGLRRLRRVSGDGTAVWKQILKVRPLSKDGRLRVLDVGCGGGDLIVSLALRAAKLGRHIQFEGCDISEFALDHARRYAAAAAPSKLNFFRHDILEAKLPEHYDVVMCTLFLHHFDDIAAEIVLERLAEASRQFVLVEDLCRTRMGWMLAWLGSYVLTRSPVVHRDGPLSVQRAFRRDEILELANRIGLADPTVELHWPERFLLMARTT